MTNGWIKLHRKITEWEWYKDLSTSKLFIHLVIMANHEDKNWKGVEVKRGQLITGRKVLAEETGLSEQQIRTSLTKLKSTSEITINSTNKYTIVTICEYETYQLINNDINQQVNQQPNQQSTNNQPQTRIIRSKEDNNIPPLPPKGEIVYSEDFETFWKDYPRRIAKGAAFRAWKKIKPDKSLVEKILISVHRQKMCPDWKKEGGKFIPHPATWLNGCRWEDETETTTAATRPKVQCQRCGKWVNQLYTLNCLECFNIEKEKRERAIQIPESNQRVSCL
jgi:hypothetical protein